ncbi:MAG: hypothetical protein AAF481_16320 [Acidobacteriota bacterium]
MAKVFTGAIGIAVAANGWAILLVSRNAFQQELRIPLVSMVFAVYSVAMYSIISHYREYCVGARMIVRLEKAMGFYDESFYLDGSALYERQHSEWGTGPFSSHVIKYYVVSLALLAIVSAALSVFLPTT